MGYPMIVGLLALAAICILLTGFCIGYTLGLRDAHHDQREAVR